MNRLIVTSFILLFGTSAFARKFDLDKHSFAPYVKGNMGTTTVGQDGFKNANGNAGIKEEVEYQYAGEIGLLITGKKVGLRVGVMGIFPQKMDAIEGQTASGAKLYNLNSKILGVFPVAHLEFSPVIDSGKRIYFALGGGAGTVTIINEYTFTSIGTAQYNIPDFTEEALAYAYLMEGSIGAELSMDDNATILFDLGYRYLVADKFTHQRSVTTFNGAVNKGDKVVNSDGTSRYLDLSSAFFGLGFRFYFN